MKLLTLGLLLSLFGAKVSQASMTTKAFAYKQISQNLELQETLSSMGYESIDSAADAFNEAAEAIEKTGESVNLGTLALCGEFSGHALIMGFSAGICSTFFNAYAVVHGGLAVGDITKKDDSIIAGASLTGAALYFRTEDGKENSGEHCFGGLDVTLGAGQAMGGTAAAELSCEAQAKGSFVFKKGFLAVFRYGVGTGATYKAELIKVNHLKKYKGFLGLGALF